MEKNIQKIIKYIISFNYIFLKWFIEMETNRSIKKKQKLMT